MRVRSSWFLAMLVVGVPSIGGGATSVVAQAGDEAVRNPYIGDPDAIEQGKTFFRLSCALCHGLDARGTFRGPDLTAGRWIHGSSDADIFRTVTDGIAGTEMAASQFSDVENWMTIAYVRSLGAASRPPLAGDPRVGERIFFEQSDCLQCHMIDGRGGRLEPDLSRIGASRSPEQLREAIRQPDANISRQFEPVSVTTGDGRRIEGVIRNEDTFSIQIMDYGENLHFFFKDEVAQVTYGSSSVMPTYSPRDLGDEELRQLVAYLDGLRGR